MPTGVIVLLVVAILVYFGLLHRVLDRMRLDDRTALFVIFLMVLGSFFNLTILRRPELIVNIGGAIIPIGVAVYLIATADTSQEKVRGTVGAIVAGAAIYLATKFLNPEEQTMLIDPTYFFALIAGVVGYLGGRSRRGAFIAGTLGVVVADIAHYVEISARGIAGRTWIGGAGAFDAVVIAGILAVGLAEVVGETREFMARGTAPGPGGAGDHERSQARPSEKHKDEQRKDKESFTAAFGVGGGSGRPTRSRESHRAGRGKRIYGDSRSRPLTSGGPGWEAPIVGDDSGRFEAASETETLANPTGPAGPPEATEPGRSDLTEPATSLAPGTGLNLEGIESLSGGVSETEGSAKRYGSPQSGRTGAGARSGGRGKAGSGPRGKGVKGHGTRGGEAND